MTWTLNAWFPATSHTGKPQSLVYAEGDGMVWAIDKEARLWFYTKGKWYDMTDATPYENPWRQSERQQPVDYDTGYQGLFGNLFDECEGDGNV